MLTSAAIISGMCFGSICLAALVAKAADNTTPVRRNLVTTKSMDVGRPATGGGYNELSVDDTPGKEHGAGRVMSWEHSYEQRSGRHTLGSDGATERTRQVTIIQDMNPPPGGNLAQPAILPDAQAGTGYPYQPSFAGGVRVATGDIDGAAGMAPNKVSAGLVSLQSLGSMNELFANSRGGDQGSPAVRNVHPGAAGAVAAGNLAAQGVGYKVVPIDAAGGSNPAAGGTKPYFNPKAFQIISAGADRAGPGAGPHVKAFQGADPGAGKPVGGSLAPTGGALAGKTSPGAGVGTGPAFQYNPQSLTRTR